MEVRKDVFNCLTVSVDIEKKIVKHMREKTRDWQYMRWSASLTTPLSLRWSLKFWSETLGKASEQAGTSKVTIVFEQSASAPFVRGLNRAIPAGGIEMTTVDQERDPFASITIHAADSTAVAQNMEHGYMPVEKELQVVMKAVEKYTALVHLRSICELMMKGLNHSHTPSELKSMVVSKTFHHQSTVAKMLVVSRAAMEKFLDTDMAKLDVYNIPYTCEELEFTRQATRVYMLMHIQTITPFQTTGMLCWLAVAEGAVVGWERRSCRNMACFALR